MDKDKVKAQDVQEKLKEALSKNDPKKLESLSKLVGEGLNKGLDTIAKAHRIFANVNLRMKEMETLLSFAEETSEVIAMRKELHRLAQRVHEGFSTPLSGLEGSVTKQVIDPVEKARVKVMKLANKDIKNQKG